MAFSLQARIAERQSSNRQDGYTNNSPVFQFQRDIETSHNPNYAALRDTLAWARGNAAVTLQDLHARYIVLTSN